jgi:membrane-bound ClpP family serine protease
MFRRVASLLLLVAALVAAAPALGQDATAPGAVVVADVRGPLDQRALDFITDVLGTADAQIVVFRFDSPGISSGDSAELEQELASDRVATAVWVGPSGATGYGPVARMLLEETDVAGVAPGARIGFFPDGPLADEATTVSTDGPPPAEIDVVTPTIGQFIIGLDGTSVSTAAGPLVLETARTIESDAGIEVLVPSVEVRFLKPGLFTRFLRLASRPEATFFFLLLGLAAVAFEFYAAGVGITAAVAALALFLAGYGFATMPIAPLGLVLTLLGMLAYTVELQRNQLGPLSVVGTGLLVWGGVVFADTGPGYPPRWWAVVLTVAGIALFYAFAITTVMRARFSTRTIGREQLVGRTGTAETGFDPTGVVLVDGARWTARSHRAAGIRPGDAVEVIEVKGIMLEVGPVGDRPRDGVRG